MERGGSLVLPSLLTISVNDTGGKVTTCVVTSGRFTADVITPIHVHCTVNLEKSVNANVVNLLSVTMTSVVNFAASVIDTGSTT